MVRKHRRNQRRFHFDFGAGQNSWERVLKKLNKNREQELKQKLNKKTRRLIV